MVMVYILIRAEHGKIGLVKAAMAKYEEIEEIHEVFGRYDIITKVVTETTKDFKKFIQNKIRIMEGIKSIEPIFLADED